jgi:hypothetical protein
VSRTTSIRQSALRLAAVVVVAGLVAGAESATAGNGTFQLDRSVYNMPTNPVVKVPVKPDFTCTIGGPVEFRNLYVTSNLSWMMGGPIRARIAWQAKIGGQVVSGKIRPRAPLYPGQTLSIPTGRGGSGVCQAKAVVN